MFKRLSTLKKKRGLKKQISSLKKIEKILHPCPTIGAVEILHRHQGKKIVFSAWVKNTAFNGNRSVEVSRDDVLYDKDFYKSHWGEFVWLCEGSAESSKAV